MGATTFASVPFARSGNVVTATAAGHEALPSTRVLGSLFPSRHQPFLLPQLLQQTLGELYTFFHVGQSVFGVG